MDGTIKSSNVILGGDLNFIVSAEEIWGQGARMDPLGPSFIEFFKSHGLVDIELVDMKPTWRNRRRILEGISKRLNRFYMTEDLLSKSHRFRS